MSTSTCLLNKEDIMVLKDQKDVDYVSAVILKINITLHNRKKKKDFFYLTTHSTHFIYGYMVSDIW